MPGTPRIGNKRLIPLRDIGIRFIIPRNRSHTVTSEAPPSGGGVTWLSCQIGNKTNPEQPKPFIQPEFIFLSAVTVIRNPNYTTFNDPCSRFE